MKFGLACEGVTDYITLKNILCGYFPDINPRTQIRQLQPELDETDEKQLDFGGWEKLINYLQSENFQDTLETMDFIIIQIDSDISQHKNFGVSHYDENNQEFSVEKLFENIKNRLIEFINLEDSSFYRYYSDKIIFAICIHSLECWFYAFYNKETLKNPKTKGCGKALNHLFKVKGFDGEKGKELYREYSKAFLKYKNLETLAKKDLSFKLFINQLEPIDK